MSVIPPFTSFLKALAEQPTLLISSFAAAAMMLVNGWTDAPVAIAPSVNSGAVGFKKAVMMAAVCNFAGAAAMMAAGNKVAVSIYEISGLSPGGRGSGRAFAAAMAAVVIWSLFALYFGLPTSEGHALMAALAGAAARIGSPDAFDGALWATVACGVFLSTVPTALASAAVAGGIERLIAKKRVSGFRLKKLQVTGAALTCFAHGAQDGQKFAGVFTVAAALCMRAPEKTVTVPLWTAILSALLISSGMLLGGKKIVKSMGAYTPAEPAACIAADITASSVLILLSAAGIPVSTTHAKVSSLMGADLSKRRGSGRCLSLYFRTAAVWLLTFPACAALGFLLAGKIGFEL